MVSSFVKSTSSEQIRKILCRETPIFLSKIGVSSSFSFKLLGLQDTVVNQTIIQMESQFELRQQSL